MKAMISARNFAEFIILPFLITDDFKNSKSQKNERIGDMVIIGKLEPTEYTLKAFVPNKEHKKMALGSKADPQYYIDWLERLRGDEIPLRLIVIENDEEIVNTPIVINDCDIDKIKSGTYITLDISEFRFKNVRAL